MTELATRLERRLGEEKAAYEHGHHRPLGAYTALMATYGAVVAALTGLARRRRTVVLGGIPAGDLVLFGVATHKLSRIVTKDLVTSPVRAPFTTVEGSGGPAEVEESPRGRGLRKAVGELVHCPFCMGEWIATGFVAGSVFAPRFTRLAASVFGVLALSDWLQFAYTALEERAAHD